MKLIVGFKDHRMIELNDIQHIIYGVEEITYMQGNKIFTIKDVATFTVEEDDKNV